MSWRVFATATSDDDFARLSDRERTALNDDLFAWVDDGPPRGNRRVVFDVEMFEDLLPSGYRVLTSSTSRSRTWPSFVCVAPETYRRVPDGRVRATLPDSGGIAKMVRERDAVIRRASSPSRSPAATGFATERQRTPAEGALSSGGNRAVTRALAVQSDSSGGLRFLRNVEVVGFKSHHLHETNDEWPTISCRRLRPTPRCSARRAAPSNGRQWPT